MLNQVRLINLDADLPQIESWFMERGQTPPSHLSYPQIGAIIPNVAALFLYQTDSNIGFIEGLISNPATTREQRLDAMEALLDTLVSEAKELKINKLLSLANQYNVARTLSMAGFSAQGEYMFFNKSLESK